EVVAAAFSPDGRKVLTGSKDRTARFWDVAEATPWGSPLQHEATVTAVGFSPDGRTVLTGTVKGTVRFWDVATCKPLGPPLHHKSGPGLLPPGGRRVALAPDGRRVVTGTAAGHVRCWPAPPAPLEGSAERLALWGATLTDRDLDTAGVVGWQKPEQWQD